MIAIESPKFIEKYKTYEREGGVIDFRIFQLDTEQEDTPYQKHLAVAQQTLISVAEEANTRLDRMAAKLKMNRRELFTMDYDFNIPYLLIPLNKYLSSRGSLTLSNFSTFAKENKKPLFEAGKFCFSLRSYPCMDTRYLPFSKGNFKALVS